MFINSGQYQLIIMQRLHNELPVVEICNLPNIIAKTIREDKVTRKRFKRSSLPDWLNAAKYDQYNGCLINCKIKQFE